jgi:hypothetical protein
MILTAMIFLSALGVAADVANENHQPLLQPAPMKCETGPIRRTFGGSEWLIYSCEDQASMVVVSAQGNPASPFYFFLKSTGGVYQITGEGNGDREASTAAAGALESMSLSELMELLASTKIAS